MKFSQSICDYYLGNVYAPRREATALWNTHSSSCVLPVHLRAALGLGWVQSIYTGNFHGTDHVFVKSDE